MLTTLSCDNDPDRGFAELAAVKEASRYNYCISWRDHIMKSCDIQLRNALRGCGAESMQSQRREGNSESMAEVHDTTPQP